MRVPKAMGGFCFLNPNFGLQHADHNFQLPTIKHNFCYGWFWIYHYYSSSWPLGNTFTVNRLLFGRLRTFWTVYLWSHDFESCSCSYAWHSELIEPGFKDMSNVYDNLLWFPFVQYEFKDAKWDDLLTSMIQFWLLDFIFRELEACIRQQ